MHSSDVTIVLLWNSGNQNCLIFTVNLIKFYESNIFLKSFCFFQMF